MTGELLAPDPVGPEDEMRFRGRCAEHGVGPGTADAALATYRQAAAADGVTPTAMAVWLLVEGLLAKSPAPLGAILAGVMAAERMAGIAPAQPCGESQ